MRHILLVLFLFPLALFSQQNKYFREVSDFFDSRKQSMLAAFKQEYNRAGAYKRATMRHELEEMLQKIDSVENVRYLEALIRTKNEESLRKSEPVAIPAVQQVKGSTSAEYPGGFGQLSQFLKEHFYYDGETDRVLRTDISFIVERDGSITYVQTNGENPIFNRQAEIAMYRLPGRFSPAVVNGLAVRSCFRLPLSMDFPSKKTVPE